MTLDELMRLLYIDKQIKCDIDHISGGQKGRGKSILNNC